MSLSFEDKIDGARNGLAERVYRSLKQMQEYNFIEGDILIHKTLDWTGVDVEWVTEKFSGITQAPRKYKVVHVDDVGLPYVQRIGMKGGVIGDIKCLAGYDDSSDVFIHDPDFIDHQIIADDDDTFDPQEVYKENRDEYFKTKYRGKRKTKQA